MSEMLNVRVIQTGEKRTIPDVEPVESAKLFWQISDKIWKQKPEKRLLTCYSVPSTLPALAARDALNEVLGGIDKDLVVSGIGKAVKLGGYRPYEEVELSPELLDNPADAHIGTFNWDERNTWRYADIDGKYQGVAFTDGHKDYYRELYAGLNFRDEKDQTVQLTYSMQRMQYTQDDLTSLTKTIWLSQFAEMGYEGDHLQHVQLSVEQELRVLNVFRTIGGIALKDSTRGQ